MPDIVSIGELLVDFTYVSGENGDTFYKQNAGGAPATLCAWLQSWAQRRDL